MNASPKTEELFADNLKARLNPALVRNDFIEDCLFQTRQLHNETNNTSILLFYAMLTLGRHTKGTSAVQKFTQLYKELGNEECAEIVNSCRYRECDLAFYWSTTQDLSRLFEPSLLSPVQTYSSHKDVRNLSSTIMNGEWDNYTFYEVDKMPAKLAPKNWGLYNVPNATIAYDTAEFAVLDDEGRPVLKLCSANYQHVYFTNMFRDHILRENAPDNSGPQDVKLDDALMIQDLIRQPNFCHWLLDQLPRLRHLEDSQRIIMYKLAPFMKNMLETMGIDPERVHELNERAVLSLGNLTIESSMAEDFFHPCQHANQELINFIEHSLLSTSEYTNDKPFKPHVYLSRNKYEGRRISNESELLLVLKKYGFETVYPEELSMHEQIQLFKNARVIVAPHGASLANTIFCKNVTLIEIFNQNYGTPTFYLIAKLLGFEYQHILGNNPLLSDEEKAQIGLPNLQYENMEVNLSRLEECLKTVFTNQSSNTQAPFWLGSLKGLYKRFYNKLL